MHYFEILSTDVHEEPKIKIIYKITGIWRKNKTKVKNTAKISDDNKLKHKR